MAASTQPTALLRPRSATATPAAMRIPAVIWLGGASDGRLAWSATTGLIEFAVPTSRYGPLTRYDVSPITTKLSISVVTTSSTDQSTLSSPGTSPTTAPPTAASASAAAMSGIPAAWTNVNPTQAAAKAPR